MADYSTTMGILQPQVGKSGDILLKFERKNGGGRTNLTYDISTLKMAKDFQV